MKDVLKNYRILLWVFLVVISITFIGFNLNPRGVQITHKETNATIPLAINDIIYKINDQVATPELIAGNFYGPVKLETNKGGKFFNANGTLGISVRKTPSSNLRFGLDIEGGIRAVIKPNQTEKEENITISQIISTLQTRINIYGLREASFRSVWYEKQGFIEITMAGAGKEELKELLERQGKFEAKIPLVVKLTNNTGSLDFNSRHVVFVSNDSIKIDDLTLKENDTITIDNIPLRIDGINPLNMTATVFTGQDITLVYFDPQRSRIEPFQNGYRWFFQVQITKEGAERFAAVTKNLDRYFDPNAGESYLSSKIYLYLDDKLVDALNIVGDLKGKVINEPSITGFAPTLEEATKSQRRLQSILRSGSLPTGIEIVSMDVVSPNLGEGFLENALLAILAAVAAVAFIISIRYRKIKIILPMMATSMSEVIIILGLSVIIGWTIDLAAIAAIIAIIGTGIDAQIILIDQAIRGEEKHMTLKEKIQRAFFIIVGAGGTVIGAMLPLMVLGLGMLRGFAITTMIGVLIGIFITRPAFGEIVKKVV